MFRLEGLSQVVAFVQAEVHHPRNHLLFRRDRASIVQRIHRSTWMSPPQLIYRALERGTSSLGPIPPAQPELPRQAAPDRL